MAIKTVPVANGSFVINSADTYVIGDVNDGLVGTWAIHLVSASFSGVVVPKVRSRAIGSAASTPAFVATPYLPLYLNGAVGTYGTGSSANITDTSYILVPSSGGVVALDCTTFTSGSFTVYCTPLVGAAA